MSTELDSIKYSKVDNANLKEVKTSPAKTITFRRYIDHLTARNSNHISDLNPGRFHIYTFPIIPGITNERKWKWEKENDNDIYYIKQYAGKDIGCLKTTTFVTVDSKTRVSSERAYEQFLDIPVSAWLFSSEKKFESYIKDDYNYMQLSYSPVINKLLRRDTNKFLEQNGLNFKYWGMNYDFDEHYNHEDYLVYGFPETILIDDVTKMMSAPSDYDVTRLTSRTAAIVIVYHADNFKVPVIYTELHNTFYSTGGTIRIEWSQNGIISVE